MLSIWSRVSRDLAEMASDLLFRPEQTPRQNRLGTPAPVRVATPPEPRHLNRR